MKTTALLTLSLALGAALLLAKDAWEKPFTEWKQKDVAKVLTDSPWADQYVKTRQIAGKGSGIGGEKELFDTVTVRFFTALPIRHAYYRLLQLINKYDEMDDASRQVFEQKFSGILHRDTSQEIIVAMEFATNDRELALRMDRHLNTTTAELIKQDVNLISDRLGRVQITGYFPPSPDGTGTKFVFPREVDGQPVVAPEDKEVKFELYLPEIGRVIITQKIKDMMYQEKLEI